MNNQFRRFTSLILAKAKSKPVRIERIAMLGDHDGVIQGSRAGYVFVTDMLTSQVNEVWNQTISADRTAAVKIGIRSDMPDIEQVLGWWNVFGTPMEQGVPFHDHTYPAYNTTWIDPAQFKYMLVLPTSGFVIQLYGGVIMRNGIALTVPNQTLDLAADKPASGALYDLIQCNDMTGLISVETGSTVDSKEMLANSDIPEPDAGNFRLCAIRLYDGQDAIQRNKTVDDFVDLRFSGFFNIDADMVSAIHAAAADAPLDADEWGFFDVVDAVLKKITWANIKATLKTYFDGIYSALGHTHSYLSDAPSDGVYYGRKDAAWIDLKIYFDTLYAVIAKGVTNGDSHDHNGGDGAIIDYNNLDNLPIIPSGSAVDPQDVGAAPDPGFGPEFSYYDHVHQGSTGGGVTSGPEGFADNYIITPSVATNDLIVAIKTIAGTNPAAGDEVTVRIGDVKRTLSAALSVTIDNATGNVFNAGSAEFKMHDVPLFIYLGWRASTSTMFILVSRIPWGKTYADFSTTATNEKYGAYSGAAPASTDPVENIGVFYAQNSGSASYNWSIPSPHTRSMQTLISEECDWTPAITGSGSMGYTVSSLIYSVYRWSERRMEGSLRVEGSTTGTASADVFFTAPFGMEQGANFDILGPAKHSGTLMVCQARRAAGVDYLDATNGANYGIGVNNINLNFSYFPA